MLKFAVAAAVFAMSAQAQATLLTRDWKASNDGLVVYDTNSGLEWLAFSQTDSSHAAIRASLADTYQGFRFANSSELLGLFHTYVPGFGSASGFQAGNDAGIFNQISSLTDMLQWDRSPTAFVNTCEFSFGCDAAGYPAAGAGIKRHIISIGDTDPDSYFLYFNNDNMFTGQQALVRVAVGEPATVLLLGACMLGLFSRRLKSPA